MPKIRVASHMVDGAIKSIAGRQMETKPFHTTVRYVVPIIVGGIVRLDRQPTSRGAPLNATSNCLFSGVAEDITELCTK